MARSPSLLLLLSCLWSACQGFTPVLQPTNRPAKLLPKINAPVYHFQNSNTALKGAKSSLADAMLDMSRERYKLESMATYSTITALIMNACLRLYTSQKFAKDPETGATRWVQHVFSLLSIVCIVSGAFTAVLFNILGIYSKESLGMQNDMGYMAFQAATAIHRKWGFRTFLSTCLSFVGSFLLSVYERAQAGSKDKKFLQSRGLWIFAIAVLLTGLAAFHIQHVLSLATELIYTQEYKAKHLIA